MRRFLFAICVIATFISFTGCDIFRADPLEEAIERLQQQCDQKGLKSWKACAEIEIVRGLKATRAEFLKPRTDDECVPALAIKAYLSTAQSYCQNDDERAFLERQIKGVLRCK